MRAKNRELRCIFALAQAGMPVLLKGKRAGPANTIRTRTSRRMPLVPQDEPALQGSTVRRAGWNLCEGTVRRTVMDTQCAGSAGLLRRGGVGLW